MANGNGKNTGNIILIALVVILLGAVVYLIATKDAGQQAPQVAQVAAPAPTGQAAPAAQPAAPAKPKASGEPIKIGGIMDTTGATSDVGKDYALGMEEAFKYINDDGGINGRPIKYIWFDYGYRIPEAVTKYKLLKRMGVNAIMGWGTGDTEALSRTVNKDEIPYVSASYSAHLTDPKKTRYNLFFSPDYSTNARAALTAWFDHKWPKHPDYGKRKPRLACAYMFASPYCSAPIKAIKDHAEMLGFEVGDDQDVSLFALDTKSQINAMKRFDPDVVWHGNTTMSVAATLRDAYSLDLGADFIVNNWGFDENLPRLAREAAEGVMGATPCGFFGQNFPNMEVVKTYAEKYNPSIPLEKRLIRTVQAWGDAMILAEALKRAEAAGDLSGQGIMINGFETMRNYDFGLGANPVTYTDQDHRPTTGCMIQEFKDGQFQKVAFVDLKERWPEKWEKEWFGW